MSTIAVIDYGMGNLRSVSKALEHVVGAAGVRVTYDADEIRRADRVVFPGQGAARDCMAEIKRLELDTVIVEVIQQKPFLGICMGLQVLMEGSDEGGDTTCLGIYQGRVKRFANPLLDHDGSRLKVPHMGWNQVRQTRAHPLWKGIADDSRFYFVHSYHVDPVDTTLVTGSTAYPDMFPSVLAHDNVFAVQFHPEKSQHAGLALLANFAKWDGKAPT